jgi:hypothetical protein
MDGDRFRLLAPQTEPALYAREKFLPGLSAVRRAETFQPGNDDDRPRILLSAETSFKLISGRF